MTNMRPALRWAGAQPVDRPPPLVTVTVTSTDLAVVRAACRVALANIDFDDERCEMLIFAIHEALVNAIQHGGGQATMALDYDGATVVAEISDQGPGMAAEIPRRPPPSDAPGGRGLWASQQMVDLMILTSDSNGTTLRLEMTHDRTQGTS